ncbi:Uncharacterized protein DBV15_04230 [Temnothorax longispinosus]|uniref:Uncharacterized protein n=1 Tax=Temnothorax longispinosus TaxID=300112 RepID=A0A4S2KLB0_9HYME|nr:Uncharacterized protein DBV15_04230 [Temnothorax longispinosus]
MRAVAFPDALCFRQSQSAPYESDCGVCNSPSHPPYAFRPLNIVNPIHTSMFRGCTCKPPLALSEIIALHDTFACSCTNAAKFRRDSCAARGRRNTFDRRTKDRRIVRESIDSPVPHSRRTADPKCLNALPRWSDADCHCTRQQGTDEWKKAPRNWIFRLRGYLLRHERG